MDRTIENINLGDVSFHKPSLNLRIKAMFVDLLIVIISLMIISLVLSFFNVKPELINPVLLGLFFLYEPITVSLGGTIGQRIMGLRVIKAKSLKDSNASTNIGIGFSVFRFLAKFILGSISLITIHSTSYGQAIHDKISGSIVTFK